jgi:hypothetical protein
MRVIVASSLLTDRCCSASLRLTYWILSSITFVVLPVWFGEIGCWSRKRDLVLALDASLLESKLLIMFKSHIQADGRW